jgi:hypothetical protein
MKKQIRSLLLALLAGVTAASTSSLKAQSSWDFKYSGSIVQWTAPQTGSYEITAYGAQGGGFGNKYVGGLGAIMSGTFQLNQGDVLNILVGHGGNSGYSHSGLFNNVTVGGSGGGGSFVVGPNNNTTPLVVAGGGGGISGNCTGASDATTSTTGNNATGTAKSNQEGSGGTGGGGGSIGSNSSEYGGGGGGGFSGNGGTHYQTSGSNHGQMNAEGGFSYLNGGAGGGGNAAWLQVGGFGGGGAGACYSASGGGGGYSGGGGGGVYGEAAKGQTVSGGGGSSYLASSATDTSMSVENTGNGLVTIDLVSTAVTPTLTFRQPSYSFAYSPNAQFPLKAYSESPGAITFSSGDSSVVSIAGNFATIVGVGQATITATMAPAPGFRSTSASITVTINKTTPYVGLVCPSSIAFSKGKSFALKTATSSNGAVTFTSSNPSVIVINGSKATLLKKGTVTITAAVASTANYTSATGTQAVIVK